METPMAIALSAQSALRQKLNIIAHNVANANTTGFKHQRMQFNEFLMRTAPRQEVSMVQDRALFRNLSEGPLIETGNSFHVALMGPGYFTVETPMGPRYTRAGDFQLDGDGRLVDQNGLAVLDQGGNPIRIPDGSGSISIDGTGTITADGIPGLQIGRLDVVTFENEQAMMELGGGLYATDQDPEPAPPETEVRQGVLEGSNVQPVVELTQMIEVSRSYERASRLLDGEHERIRRAVSELGRLSG